MNLTAAAFTYRKLVFFILVGLFVWGGVSYFTLPAREDPEITIRQAIVTTRYPGLAPERVEQLITRTLEEEIRKISEVESVRSTSSTGLSLIHVEIADRYDDLDPIFQDLRNKVRAAERALPEGTRTPVVNDEFGDVAVVTLALTADGFEMREMFDIAKHVRDSLYAVEGTKRIDLLGVQAERVFLEGTNARFAQLGLSPNQLLATLESQNVIRPGGEIDTGQRSFVVEPTGNYRSVEDIGETLIAVPDSTELLPLKDIVDIRRGYVDPPDRPAYFDGEPAIVFAISMLSGYNVLEFSPRLKAAVEDIEATLPIGLSLKIATYQADQVEATVRGVSYNVLQTLAIVLVVVMVFLGVRLGLVVGAIVPLVMTTTLALMNLFGLSLERMSLATLIISLGLLVDNGIVIAEDFKRRLQDGDPREKALTETGRELALPLASSSASTILFFLPLMLAEHVAGEYTRSISLVILITLATSWFIALAATPTLCYWFVPDPRTMTDADAARGSAFDRLRRRYRVLLCGALRARLPFLVLMAGLFIAAVASMRFVPQQFFPDSDRPQILVNVELPSMASARETDRTMRRIFAWLDDDDRFPEIDSFAGYSGFGGPRFVLSLDPEDPADNKGFIVVNVSGRDEVGPLIADLRRGFVTQFPDVAARVTKMFLGPSDSSVIEIQVKGPDAGVLFATAREIEDLMHEVPGTIDIRNDWEDRVVKVLVEVDQQRARRAGVTSADVAASLQAYFDGRQVTEYREEDDIFPVVLRAEAKERYNLDRMRTIGVYSESRGSYVPLMQVADFRPVNEYARIQREDMFRTITVEARHLTLTAEDLKRELDDRIAGIAASLPVNHHIEYDGVIVEAAEAQKALSANVPLVLGAVVVLLVAQFNSYRRPLIIVLTIPLSFVGAVIGLIVMRAPFGFMVSLGLYSLAGIIINHAIVLIDRIDLERKAGKGGYDAIVDACVMRLRPVAMTTVTTVLGLLPLIVTRDPLFYGMAVVIGFGLAVGTVLTLGVVPVLYSLFFRAGRPQRPDAAAQP